MKQALKKGFKIGDMWVRGTCDWDVGHNSDLGG